MTVGRIFTCTSSAPDRTVCQRKRDVAASYGVCISVWYSSVAVKGSDQTGGSHEKKNQKKNCTTESAGLSFLRRVQYITTISVIKYWYSMRRLVWCKLVKLLQKCAFLYSIKSPAKSLAFHAAPLPSCKDRHSTSQLPYMCKKWSKKHQRERNMI